MTKKATVARAVASACAGTAAPRIRTHDALQTFDQQTIDSAGAFLKGELERLDQELHTPLYTSTWGRDIDLREDVSMGDEATSFMMSSFAAPGGPVDGGKNWVGKNSNEIKGMQVSMSKTVKPLTPWALQLSWTMFELASAQNVGRPIDTQKHDGMKLKHEMDVDAQVYVGDSDLGATGLLNNPEVEVANVANGDWADLVNGADTTSKVADKIVADVNDFLHRVWENTGWTMVPELLRLPPKQFSLLVATKISDAGNISILRYLQTNNLCYAQNGRQLDIQPIKWLQNGGVGDATRMFAYTKRKDLVRFPMVPMQNTPIEHRDLSQLTTYYCLLGEVEWVYPETGGYADGI